MAQNRNAPTAEHIPTAGEKQNIVTASTAANTQGRSKGEKLTTSFHRLLCVVANVVKLHAVTVMEDIL